MKNKLLSFILLIGFAWNCYAQSPTDTVDLNTAEVSCIMIVRTPTAFDSIREYQMYSSLGDVLSENSSVQVNQYGERGGVQSLSVRGFNTSQNQVNWNGIPINSITLGMFDFAGSSLGNFDEVSLLKGSSSTSYGDGAIGGTLVLKNKADWGDQGFTASAGFEAGSFHLFNETYSINYNKRNLSYKLQYIDEYVKNDFEFKNTKKIGKPTEVQEHAEFWNTSINQELHYRNGKHQLSWITWLSGRKKNNPNLMTDGNPSQQSTADSSIRSVLNYQIRFMKSQLNIDYGFVANRFKYWDYAKDIYTNYLIKENIGSINWIRNLNDFRLRVSSRVQFQDVQNNNYLGTPSRVQTFNKAALSYREFYPFSLFLNTGFQSSSSTNYVAPVLGLNYKWRYSFFKFDGGINNHYRYPTFNDLFWIGGGNSQLKPETGFSTEQNISYKKWGDLLKSEFKAGVYYSEVENL